MQPWRLWVSAVAVGTFIVGAGAMQAWAQAPEKKDVKLGVGGSNSLYYLPLAITERLGFFKEQGLNVEVSDFKGGTQSLTALVGGSVDVVTGAYEHTIRMQVKGQDIVAVVELGRYPGIVLAVKKDRMDKIKSIADLKGAKIGVTAPGSSTNMIAWYLMSKSGLKPDDASFIGVGAGPSAIAAIKRGDIDAISNIDPVIATLEASGDVVVMADTRTTEGATKVFGGPMPAGGPLFQTRLHREEPQHRAGARQRLLQIPEMAGEGHAGADRRRRPAGILAGRQGAVHEGGAGQPAGLFARRHRQRGAARSARSITCASSTRRSPTPTVDTAKTWDDRFVKKAAGR